MRCPLASQLPFVVLETDTDALVVHPGPRVASDATYCALNRGPASTSRLSQIGIRRLGAPREVGVLLLLAVTTGVSLLLVRRRVNASTPAKDPLGGYRDAATSSDAGDSIALHASRARELAVLALVSTLWFALPAISSHVHGLVVSLL